VLFKRDPQGKQHVRRKILYDTLEGDETRELPMTLLAGSPWKNT